MPDLTIITVQQCKQLSQMNDDQGGYHQTGLGGETFWPECTCDEYKFSKATIRFGMRRVKPPCRHINMALNSRCHWREQFSRPQTPEQREKMICPLCGGPTEWIQVGV